MDLITKAHRLERQNGLAGFIHRFNISLVLAGRTGSAELAKGVDHHWYGVIVLRCCSANATDQGCGVVDSAGRPRADSDDVVLRKGTHIANVNVVTADSLI